MDRGEFLEALVGARKYTIIDNTCNGKCSKCGECCSNYLPITQSEGEKIMEYVLEHKIHPNRAKLIMENKLQCPYFNGRCMIYEVRPLICKEFYCNRKPEESIKAFMKEKEQRIPVDMWNMANYIDECLKKKEKK